MPLNRTKSSASLVYGTTTALPYEKVLMKSPGVENRQLFGVEFHWAECPIHVLKYPAVYIAGREHSVDDETYSEFVGCFPSGVSLPDTYVWNAIVEFVNQEIQAESRDRVELVEVFDLLQNSRRFFLVPSRTATTAENLAEAMSDIVGRYQPHLATAGVLRAEDATSRWHQVYIAIPKMF